MGRHLVGVVIGSLSMTLACVSPNLVGTALAFSCTTGSTTVCTFEAVSAAEEFAVPATANSFTVTAVGGAGGQGFKNINNVPGGDGGNGAQVSAAFTNMAGKILKVLVAGNGGSSDGSTAGAGGFNLGGTGGTEAGGGGGASELDICATYPSNCPTRLLVAGGGGGGGAGSPTGVGGSGDGSTSVATPGAGSAGGNYGCDIAQYDDRRRWRSYPSVSGHRRGGSRRGFPLWERRGSGRSRRERHQPPAWRGRRRRLHGWRRWRRRRQLESSLRRGRWSRVKLRRLELP